MACQCNVHESYCIAIATYTVKMSHSAAIVQAGGHILRYLNRAKFQALPNYSHMHTMSVLLSNASWRCHHVAVCKIVVFSNLVESPKCKSVWCIFRHDGIWRYSTSCNWVTPGCVLSSPLAYIQMMLITTTFHGKIGTFEGFCECLRPSWTNNGPALFCCDMLWCPMI